MSYTTRAISYHSLPVKDAVTVFRERAVETAPKELTKLLMSIPRIGVTIAPTLIAEIGDITRFKDLQKRS